MKTCKICGKKVSEDAFEVCNDCWEIENYIKSLNKQALIYFTGKMRERYDKILEY